MGGYTFPARWTLGQDKTWFAREPVSISRPKKVHGLASERLDQALNDTRRNQGFKSDPTLYTIAPKFYDDMFETLWGSSSI
jgi:hypothetical protein